jgi:TonB-linked SusC/RagA family outer membrane protein
MRSFKKLSLLLAFSCLSLFAVSQIVPVTGKVTDSKGNGVPGINILIRGSAKGTATTGDGSFKINAPANSTLVFSGVGYAEQTVSLNGRTSIDVSLIERQNELNQVIVTALGINRQAKSLVYSTQVVKPAELITVRDANNVLNSFQGKIANAVITQGSGGPGSGARIVLRGNRSIQHDNGALIVVDGVPIDNSTNSAAGSDFGSVQSSDGASNINPDDIESVTVLRGASAAALYGSQAGNGVVVITTKKGSKEKLSVSLNSGVQFENAFSLPKVQNTYGQGNIGAFVDPTFGDSWGPKMEGQTLTNFLGQPMPFSPQPNNIKNFFRTGNSFNNSIGVSGGSDKSQTYLSYTNNSLQGIVPGNSLLRHTITLRQSNQVSKRFSTDAKITYLSQDIKNKPRTGEENAPTIDIYNIPRNVSTNEAKNYQTISNVGVPVPTPFPSTLSSIYQNPYWLIHNTSLSEVRDRITGFLSAKFQITNWLSLTGRANLDRTFDKLNQEYYQGTLLWSHTGGYFAQQNIVNTQKWFDGIFEGNNQITKNIKVNYHVGGIFQDSKNDNVSNTADGLNVTNKFSLKFATTPNINVTGTHVKTEAAFGQASFSFKDAIFIDGSFRNDWDSRLGPPHTFQYYSIGGSAVLSDLLLQLPSKISFLKVNLNYAQVGNGGQPNLLSPVFGYSQGAGNGFLNRGTTLPFPELKPELVKSLEATLEARFYDNRLGFNLTYYKSNSSNQLLQLNIPVATGYLYKYINAGNIQNQGIELTLNATPVRTKDFNWDIAINFGLNRNKVVKLDKNIKVVYYGGGDNRSATPQIKEGGSFGDLIAFRWITDPKTHKYEVNADGTPFTTDKVAGAQQEVIGNSNPLETIGWTNFFRYKGFSLRALIDGRIGGTIVDGTEMNLAFSGIPEVTAKYREGGWNLGGVDAAGTPINKTITAQQFWQTASGKRYGVGQFFAYDASNFRLREVSLGYDIPVRSKLFVKAARLSAIARNILWIYRGKSELDIPGLGKRKMTFDPDMTLGNGNYQGISYGTLPATRSYGLNLQLTF